METALQLRLAHAKIGRARCVTCIPFASQRQVAAHFRAPNTLQTNAPEEVYPGTPGMVVTEKDGLRELRSMTWGFPLRLKTMKPEAKPRPVNNVADMTKGMWIGLARKPEWRCLIPVTDMAGRH